MANRFYSNTAVNTTITSGINNSITTIVVASTAGFPVSFPYTCVVDQGTASEELVSVTGAAGTTLTVTRGHDGTSAVTHSPGASFKHVVSAQDFREPQDHMASSSAVHGIAGSVVGTTDAQNLTNKTMSGASNTFTNIPSVAVVGLDAHTSATAAHGATGAVVGTTNAQTLTNKTLTSPAINTPTITAPAFSGTASTGLVLGGALSGVTSISASGTATVGAVSASGSVTGGSLNTAGALSANSATITTTAVVSGAFTANGGISTTTVLADSTGGEITLGYGNTGGLAIAQGNVQTHPNGIVLWVSGNSLVARKSNGADVVIVA